MEINQQIRVNIEVAHHACKYLIVKTKTLNYKC